MALCHTKPGPVLEVHPVVRVSPSQATPWPTWKVFRPQLRPRLTNGWPRSEELPPETCAFQDVPCRVSVQLVPNLILYVVRRPRQRHPKSPAPEALDQGQGSANCNKAPEDKLCIQGLPQCVDRRDSGGSMTCVQVAP